ncbi:hypothetical protein [Paludisphaera borealis]|uniref:hypothetical protein n=1 Tax=Paludisphaera borealis TaxID=1387353 RepID=UPI000970C972|nr:hypothetical protein [Paludisphaera borealis]
MAEVNFHVMNAAVREHIAQVVGQICCHQHISKDRSLSLGFGDVVRHTSAIADADHGKWEVGTYYSSWRILRGKQIVCGSQDTVDSIDALREAMNSVKWGSCTSIRQLTDFDVRVEFDNDVVVDFLATISDEDEVFHLFCPNKIVVAFSITDGWRAGPSDKPWGAERGHS